MPTAATGGDVYLPYEERTGEPSIVYFTREISPEGIMRAYEKVSQNITGKVAIKLHTGEPHGPNFTPASWVKEFVDGEGLEDARIVETNTYYYGHRYSTPDHRETLKTNGWDILGEVDIMDADGQVKLPVERRIGVAPSGTVLAKQPRRILGKRTIHHRPQIVVCRRNTAAPTQCQQPARNLLLGLHYQSHIPAEPLDMVDLHILGEYLFSGASRDGHSQMNLIPVAKAAQNLQQ